MSTFVDNRTQPLMSTSVDISTKRVKTTEQRTIIQQYGDWYTGRWWAVTFGTMKRGLGGLTAHLSTASVQYNYLCGPKGQSVQDSSVMTVINFSWSVVVDFSMFSAPPNSLYYWHICSTFLSPRRGGFTQWRYPSVGLSPKTRTCRALAWLAQQSNSAGGCERPRRCWSSQTSGPGPVPDIDGGGGLSSRPL